MSDPRTEQRLPPEGEESDFGSKLKIRLAIAAALVGLALAAIPLLDMLTGKKPEVAENNAGNIASSAGPAAIPAATASAASASAPAVASSAPTSSAPVSGAPTGPDLSQTPGMTARPPLALAPAPAPSSANPARHAAAHLANGNTLNNRSPAAAEIAPTLTHPANSHAYKPGYQPSPYAAAPYPASNNAQPSPYSQTMPALTPQTATVASQVAQPAGTSVGYNVQLGLFSNLENAQKLISELKSKGIAVESETRVHLAPFRTRVEAEQAMAKLRAMGYAPMLDAARFSRP